MRIRKARPEDAKEIVKLVRETIRKVNSEDYTKKQVNAWVSSNKAKKMREFIAGKRKVFVAVDKDKIIGMATWTQSENQVGALYVQKDRIGEGIGKKLYDRVEEEARKAGTKELKLYSTITAVPFYKKRGYKSVRKTHVTMNKVKIPCVIMKKKL